MYTFNIEFNLRYSVTTQNRRLPIGVNYTPPKSKKYFIDIVSTNKVYH